MNRYLKLLNNFGFEHRVGEYFVKSEFINGKKFRYHNLCFLNGLYDFHTNYVSPHSNLIEGKILNDMNFNGFECKFKTSDINELEIMLNRYFLVDARKIKLKKLV